MTHLESPKSKLRAVGLLAAVVALIVGLHLVARLGLSGPDSLTGQGLREWVGDPVLLIATLARWASLIMAYYLAVVIGAVLILGEGVEQSRWSWLAPTTVTSLVGLALGVSAVAVPIATQAITSPPAQAQPSNTEPLVLQEVEALALNEVEPEVSDGRLATPPGGRPSLNRDDTVIVMNGDSIWSIAEETLEDVWGRSDLTEEQIADYWRILIDANEDRLVDPGNPDLILPGQELVLPPTS